MNIEILDINNFIKKNELKGPVTSSKIYLSQKTNTFDPNGIFSEEIFGLRNSPEEKLSFSWIDLNCKVIHPFIYTILEKRIERKIDKLISMTSSFSINNDGYLIEDPNGNISGMSKLYESRKKIKFRKLDDMKSKNINYEQKNIDDLFIIDYALLLENSTGLSNDEIDDDRLEKNTDTDFDIDYFSRNIIIDKLHEYLKKDIFFIDKLLVISPAFRPIVKLEKAGISTTDTLNDIYTKIINLSNQVRGLSGNLSDILAYRIQLVLKELVDYISKKVSTKEGTIRELMLSRRADFSARTVITPNPELELGEISVPFRIACLIFEPYIIYGILNSDYSKNIPQQFHELALEFLGKEKIFTDL